MQGGPHQRAVLARVAAARDGWIWGAPTPEGDYAISLFEDPRLGRAGGAPAARLARALAETGLIAGSGDLLLQRTVAASDATPCAAPAFSRDGRLRIGDASVALDPLSSSGIAAALQSAIDAALSIHTLREAPGAEAMIETFLNGRTQRRAARHAAWTAAFYAEAAAVHTSPFWTARAQPAPARSPLAAPQSDEPIRLGNGVQVLSEPCPIGDRIAMRRVVAPTGAAEPVAFADGVEVAPLIEALPVDTTAAQALMLWSSQVGERRAARLFGLAWRAGWLESAIS